MNTLEQALNKLIKNLGIEDKVLDSRIINIWPIVVGKKIADVSKAEKITNRILYVKVKNSSWRNELIYYKKDIITKINKNIGKNVIDDIRLV